MARTPKSVEKQPIPSASLLAQQTAFLSAYAPYSHMRPEDVRALLEAAQALYFAPGETVLSPELGPIDCLYIVKSGDVICEPRSDLSLGTVHCEAGQMFPVGEALAQLPVTGHWRAVSDTFCWRIPAPRVQDVAQRSLPLAQSLAHESSLLLRLSRQALQSALASEVFSHFSMERPLAQLAVKQPVVCRPGDSIGQALALMQQRNVGSIIVADDAMEPLGIFTRKDVIGKIVLPRTPLDGPVSSVMSSPIHVLDEQDTVEDAALLMARHGIRHVPVLRARSVVNVVSERDLYALQRLSLNQVSTAARSAGSLAQLQLVARDIRLLAKNLASQGVHANSLTRLISRLNDVLTQRLLSLTAEQHQLSLDQACWLSFGSEGRSEQTIATDQDNGLVFIPDALEGDLAAQRGRWLAWAGQVNAALDACGYPLCKGGIMAGQPQCCLSLAEWQERFDHWIEHGTPEDLLKANIFFDLRPLAGKLGLGESLSRHVAQRARQTPRFLHLMAQDMLNRAVPLNWFGGLETTAHGEQQIIDLKLQGTTIFVDAARLKCLALGLSVTNTGERFEAAASAQGKNGRAAAAMAQAFGYLQMLRLQVQMQMQMAQSASDSATEETGSASHALAFGAVRGKPNCVAVNEISDIDRKLLKESLRMGQELQQEMRMDYGHR